MTEKGPVSMDSGGGSDREGASQSAWIVVEEVTERQPVSMDSVEEVTERQPVSMDSCGGGDREAASQHG